MDQFLTLLSLFHRWLDKLGIAALTNHTRVFRQSFIGGHYSLLDSKQYPLPVSANSRRVCVCVCGGGGGRGEGESGGRNRVGAGRESECPDVASMVCFGG